MKLVLGLGEKYGIAAEKAARRAFHNVRASFLSYCVQWLPSFSQGHNLVVVDLISCIE